MTATHFTGSASVPALAVTDGIIGQPIVFTANLGTINSGRGSQAKLICAMSHFGRRFNLELLGVHLGNSSIADAAGMAIAISAHRTKANTSDAVTVTTAVGTGTGTSYVPTEKLYGTLGSTNTSMTITVTSSTGTISAAVLTASFRLIPLEQ